MLLVSRHCSLPAYFVSAVACCLLILLLTADGTLGRSMTNAPPAFLVPSQAVGAKTRANDGAAVRDRRSAASGEVTTSSSSSPSSSSAAGPSTTACAVSASAAASASALHMLAPSQALQAGSSVSGLHQNQNRRNRQRRSGLQRGDNTYTVLTAAAAGSSSDASESPTRASYSTEHFTNDDNEQHDNISSSSSTNTRNDTGNKPKQRQKKQRPKHRMTGSIPDVHWRAIPLDHLRHHPSFEPLPHPDTITTLSSPEDVRLFRQDSWQWDALHSGRCTTSQATAALGLLERRAGSELGIPRSLQKGAQGAYHRLSRPGLRTLDDMREVLCTGEGNSPPELDVLDYPVWGAKTAAEMEKSKEKETKQWKKQHHKDFAANYLPRIKKSDLDRRRNILKDYYAEETSQWVARMQWGNAQEATALLTALNYFTRKVPGTKIREVGMCGAGLDCNATSPEDGTGLIIGATPDAVIHYPNGTLEALEVKNHCPFVPMSWGSRRSKQSSNNFHNNNKDLFRIREVLELAVDVLPAYVPQLMLEMLSLGPQCRSAIMVRQTATKGAVILRLQRDDEWIEEMLHWLNQFMERFVNREEPQQQQGSVPHPRSVGTGGGCIAGVRTAAHA